ncbi:MBL fold metallo-hydrolase [Microvirga sp. TS319]|uniref:MBL fold metallo-hydrolase n=1 Tax=Microvirga sp. TS319 TaxID=3241165 RepID=UPI00351A08B7
MHHSSSAERQVGDLTVWAVSDGHLAADLSVLSNLEPEEAGRLTGVGRFDQVLLPVNTFLIRLGSHFALVDAGAGRAAGPALGKVIENLERLGVRPSEIRTLLMTHLHPDHSNGLVDQDGHAVYPEAELLLHAREAEFWLDGAINRSVSERTQRNMAAARRATAPYGGRIRRIEDAEQVLPGVTAVALPGHTPGHTGWLLQSGGERLFLWGDIVHFANVQTARPEVSLVFDVDQAAARAMRTETFERVVREGLTVAGAHLPFPGFGTVVREADGYRYRPDGA